MSRSPALRTATLLTVVAVALAACTSSDAPPDAADPSAQPSATAAPRDDAGLGPEAAAVGDGPLAPATVEVLERRFWLSGRPAEGDIQAIADVGDLRLAWLLVDLLRFEQEGPDGDLAEDALARLTDARPPGGDRPWRFYGDLLLAEDVPAPPDYRRFKAAEHRIFDQRWDPFFDPSADVDWREVSWGGVVREGIATLDDPRTVAPDAPELDAIDDDEPVLIVEVDGRSRAYPWRVLVEHEVVNDRVGSAPIVVTLCTVCGSAIAFDATVAGEPRTFGTSGLLLGGNKLMVERGTESLFEQLSGRAVTGPATGAELTPFPSVTTTWGAWVATAPDADVVLPDAGTSYADLGRERVDETLAQPRQFPATVTDDRLDPDRVVVGVTGAEGPVAFPADLARRALADDRPVVAGGATVTRRDDGGLVVTVDGRPAATVTLRWFAWVDRNPATVVWRP